MPKKVKLPASPLKDAPWPLAPKEELELYLQMERERFQADRSHALPAFNALNYIVTELWRNGGAPPESAVAIPVWLLETLAEGWLRYRNAAQESTFVTLGEAYGIEGGGQGKEPRILTEAREIRDIRMATMIAIRKEKGEKIEAVLQELSSETGLSLSQVRRVWEKHREKAISAVQNLRSRISS